jgi:cytochrome c biogenesis protein
MPASSFPDARDPVLYLTVWTGDLGLDDGVPQNVYELDTSRMTLITTGDSIPVRLRLEPGQTAELPDGLGSVTFDSLDRYAGFTVRHDPARGAALVFSLLAIAGLTASLFVPRRRLWLRAQPGAGRTLVEVGALARSEDHGLAGEADAVLAAVLARLDAPPAEEPASPPDHPQQHRPEESAP